MSDQELYTALSTDSVISSLVDDRITAMIVDQETEYPCISYQQISEVRTDNLKQIRGSGYVRYSIDVYAKTYPETLDVRSAVMDAMVNAPFQNYKDQDIPFFLEEMRIYRRSMDYVIYTCL